MWAQGRVVAARYWLSLWPTPSWLQGRAVLVGGGGVHTQSVVHFVGWAATGGWNANASRSIYFIRVPRGTPLLRPFRRYARQGTAHFSSTFFLQHRNLSCILCSNAYSFAKLNIRNAPVHTLMTISITWMTIIKVSLPSSSIWNMSNPPHIVNHPTEREADSIYIANIHSIPFSFKSYFTFVLVVNDQPTRIIGE